MTEGPWAARAGVTLLVVLACLARLVHLDADPMFPSWVGYITDEGRWNESARNMVLFGHTKAFAERIHLLLSPAYQFIALLTFKFNDVSLWSARLSAALAGSAIVVLVAWHLRRHVTPSALAVGVLILGFETYLLAESRMALPEIPAALGVLASFMVLVLAPQTKRHAVLAGGLFVVALGMKGTMLLVAPALFAVACMPGPAPGMTAGVQPVWRLRLARLIAFAAGAAGPVLVVAAAGLAAGVLPVAKLLTLGDRLLGFISLVPLTTLLWDLFESEDQMARNLLLLGAWGGSWLWLHRRPSRAPLVERLYLSSAVWAGWSVLIWAVNAYAPGRYVVHVIVPAALHLMAALSLADAETPARIEARLLHATGAARAAWLVWLVLPAAVLAASCLVGVAALAGLDATRVGPRVALIAASVLALGLVAHRAGMGQHASRWFLLAPAVAALAWYLGWEFGVFRQFWEDQPQVSTLLWLLTCALAVAVAAVHSHASPARRGAVQAIILVAAASALLLRGMLPLWTPTYTIRDASRDLGRLLPSLTHDELVVHSAATLLLDNKLRYRELFAENEAFDWLLVFENNGNARRALRRVAGLPGARYRDYAFAFDPRYAIDLGKDGPVQAVLLHRAPAAAAQPASAPGGATR